MANLKLGLLGRLEITLGGAPLTGFESDKARALFVYLAVESGRPHRRESLLGLFWPDSPEERARHSLRQALSSVRLAIGDAHASPPYLSATREEIEFNPAADSFVDVCAFGALLDQCDAHAHARIESCAECANRLERAAALYRGKFLGDFFLKDSAEFEEWSLLEREALHLRALTALARLAEYRLSSAEFDAAERAARRQLELDPWREEAHRQLMLALALSGRRADALAQFEKCRRVLANELGVEPSEETRNLYLSISRGGLLPGPAEPRPTSPPRRLPVQLTPFVGRERELAELEHLLADPECRMVSLVGPGGVGKTRLALQAAARYGATSTYAPVFVPLAPLDNPALIFEAIGEAAGLAFHGPGRVEEQILAYLREKQMLLVLDNFEHLMDAAGFCAEILRSAPAVKLLVTSRVPLDLQGEWVFQVEGLGLPPDEHAEQFEAYDAVALFIQRARRARVGFDVRAEDRAAVARICRLVDGWPLGLELAAAWVRTLSCGEIAQQIESGPDFLTASLRDLPARHRSLRIILDESWNMLGQDERLVLAGLSAFRGGFERPAAEQVAGASLSSLASLVSRSLVRRVQGERYDLHELVRQYARERLIEYGALQQKREAHARFFIQLAQEAERRLRGPEQLPWLDRLDRDHDNLRAALEWTLEEELPGDPASHASQISDAERARLSLVLAGSLFIFWRRRSHWGEGSRWIGRVLARSDTLPVSPERVRVLHAGVLLAADQVDTGLAMELSDQELALARALNDPPGIAAALSARGFVVWKQKNHSQARALCEQALAVLRQVGDRPGMAEALDHLGHITINQSDYAAAQDYLDERLRICREMGDGIALYDTLSDFGLLLYLREEFASARAYLQEGLTGLRAAGALDGVVAALERLGDVARCEGDYRRAGELYAECLALYRDSGDRDEIPSLLHNEGYAALHTGDFTRALASFREALDLQHRMANRPGVAECLAGVASVLIAQGQAERGARLLSASEMLRESAGAPLWPANRMEFERNNVLLRQALDPAALSAAWLAGCALTIDQAIAAAAQ